LKADADRAVWSITSSRETLRTGFSKAAKQPLEPLDSLS